MFRILYFSHKSYSLLGLSSHPIHDYSCAYIYLGIFFVFFVVYPSTNRCLIVVEGSGILRIPQAMLSGDFCLLVESPMPNWSWVKDQEKIQTTLLSARASK